MRSMESMRKDDGEGVPGIDPEYSTSVGGPVILLRLQLSVQFAICTALGIQRPEVMAQQGQRMVLAFAFLAVQLLVLTSAQECRDDADCFNVIEQYVCIEGYCTRGGGGGHCGWASLFVAHSPTTCSEKDPTPFPENMFIAAVGDNI